MGDGLEQEHLRIGRLARVTLVRLRNIMGDDMSEKSLHIRAAMLEWDLAERDSPAGMLREEEILGR